MFEIDHLSQLVTLNSSYRLSKIEKELALEGFTLGFFAPPKNDFTLQEVLENRMGNLYGLLYGEWPDLCVGLKLESKKKEHIETQIAPRKATGPSWKNLISSKSSWIFPVENW